MALYNSTTTQQQTPGTLNSEGLYFQPNVPRQSQATGIQGSDGRAYTGNVQGNELVENRLTNLLQKKNPYIQNAQQRGLQVAAKRGLLNSSIASGSAERAAIEAGMPIASADAQTYLSTRMQNQQDLNQNLMQERDIANRMLQAGREQGTQLELADRQIADNENDRRNRLLLQRENLAFSGEQQGLDRQQQEVMSRLGYSQDLGRMGAGFEYDIGRTGYQFDLTDRNSGRDWQRALIRDEAQFANQRYATIQDWELGQLADANSFIQRIIMDDPSTDPTAAAGVAEYLNGAMRRFLGQTLDRYSGGG